MFASSDSLELCLSSIRQSSYLDFEILVADDASPNEAAIHEAAERHHARVIRLDRNRGPASARNAAAWEASGEILVFLDCDVTVHPDTLARIADAFERDPELGAVMGSYDLEPRVHGLVATFRNLLHAHVHHRSSRQATTFWTGCGGVRRRLFCELGGFDESYPEPSIEDVEFGMRLHRAGGKLALDPDIQVTHGKEWTLASTFYSDTVHRAMPWAGLMLRHGLPKDLNFRWQDRLSLLLAAAFLPLAFLALRFGRGWWPVAFADLVAIALLQFPLFLFLGRVRSFPFAVACFPLYLVHLWSAAGGLLLGLGRWEISRDRWFLLSAAVVALLIFGGIQAAGGAYSAEFDGSPDEPAHFMTGLMIRDYMAQWPRETPLSWARQFYFHYPKVSFGHWPPLFHLTEAVWWLFAPPSRVTGMLLVGLLGLIAALCFYRIARTIVHPLVALATACLLVATPVFQESAAQQMTELLTLVFGLLQMDALLRVLRNDSQRALGEAGLWGGLCLLTHGAGASLVLTPLLAVLPDGRWRRLQIRYWIWFALWIAAGLLWYPFQSSPAAWAGMGTPMPWRVDLIVALAGPGFVVLAGLGVLLLLRRLEPVTIVAASLLLSVVLASWLMRAMRAPRHFILALPALLLLSLAFSRFIWDALPRSPAMRGLAATVCVAVAVAYFPWFRYLQKPVGYAELARQVQLPARMLVSSPHGWEEGSWIVAASLRETRPGSVIRRATKVLARVGWNGENYELLADTPEKVGATLDRLGIQTVVLDEHIVGRTPSAHHKLLREMLATSSAWKQCGGSAQLLAYCRVLSAPSLPSP